MAQRFRFSASLGAIDIDDVVATARRAEELDQLGEFYEVGATLTDPLPVQTGGVPLMLAGGKQKMLTLAGT